MSSARSIWRRQAASLSSSSSSTRLAIPRPSQPLSLFTRNALHVRPRRFQSTKPSSKPPTSSTNTDPQAKPNTQATAPPPPTAAAEEEARTQTRLHRTLSKTSRWVPSRLHPYLARLRSAPLSHVGAFLVLHEMTAILPLLGLTYLFYAMDWVPTGWVLGPWAGWAEEGLAKYARYFRRKGWFGLGKGEGEADGGVGDGEKALEGELKEEVEREREKRGEREGGRGRVMAWFGRKGDVKGGGDAAAAPETADREQGTGEGGKKKVAVAWQKVKKVVTFDNTEKGYKVGIQIAAAYTITKMLLVPRLALSLWLTPWFARGLVSFRRAIFSRRKSS